MVWIAALFSLLLLGLALLQWSRVSNVRARRVAVLPLIGSLAAVAWGFYRGDWRFAVRWPPSAKASATTTGTFYLPPDLSRVDYLASVSCRKCHGDHYQTWYRTYHRTMTREATPEYVKGDFGGQESTIAGLPARFYRQGDRFFMETVDARWESQRVQAGDDPTRHSDPPRSVFSIDRVIGSHIAQIYLSRGPLTDANTRASGAYLVLPYQYSLLDRQWITRIGSFLQPQPPSLFAQTHIWQQVCIYCHNVKPRPRQVSFEPDRYQSQPAELGIACESCHGPGELHAAVHRDPLHRFRGLRHDDADPTILNPAKLDAGAGSAVCGRCHSKVGPRDFDTARRVTWDDPYTPGDPISRWYHLPLPTGSVPEPASRGNYFWEDGTPLAVGLEYQGMILSPCYQRGTGRRQMSCLSCHSMHERDPVDQLADGMRSNRACYACHQEKERELTHHTHHPAGSAGSLCYNCHMPNVVYGLLGVHRSHRVVSPSAAVSAKTNLPNACNLCHLDKTLSWTADKLAEWYGQRDLELSRDDREVASSLVMLLRGDPVQRAVAANAFWRAASTELEPGSPIPLDGDLLSECAVASDVRRSDSLRRDAVAPTPDPRPRTPPPQWAVPFLTVAMDDPYAAVRLQAHRAVRAITASSDNDYFYLDLPDRRRRAIAEILDQWSRRFAAGTDADRASTDARRIEVPDAVPLQTDATPRPDILDRLLQNRDQREVSIAE